MSDPKRVHNPVVNSHSPTQKLERSSHSRFSRYLAAASALAVFALPTIGRAQDPPVGQKTASTTLQCKMTPSEFQVWENETNTALQTFYAPPKKGYRVLDNPELAQKEIANPSLLAPGEERACWGNCVSISLPDGVAVVAGVLTEENGDKALSMMVNGKVVAHEPLNSKGEFRVVARKVEHPEKGLVVQARVVPVAKAGDQPEFTKPLPSTQVSYVISDKTVFVSQGAICPETKIGMR